MGGGRHNPADVRSAPHTTTLNRRFEGADLTSAGLWRPPPHHETEPVLRRLVEPSHVQLESLRRRTQPIVGYTQS